jgi:hypothetical protein
LLNNSSATFVDDEVDRATQMKGSDGICTLLMMIAEEAGEFVDPDPVVLTVGANQ